MIGVPELERWCRGEAVVIRLKAGTEELTIAASSMAQGELKKAKSGGAVVDFLDRIGYPTSTRRPR